MDAIHRALTQDRSLVQHRDLVGGLSDELHVVLNDEDGVVLRHALQELGRFLTLFGGHTSDLLCQQLQASVLGHQPPDPQPLHLTVGQRPRLVPRLL